MRLFRMRDTITGDDKRSCRLRAVLQATDLSADEIDSIVDLAVGESIRLQHIIIKRVA